MESAPGSLDCPVVAKQMRHISQPCGGANKDDILYMTTDDGGVDEEDLSYQAWVAFRNAARGRADQLKGVRSRPGGKASKQDDQARNGCNRRTGERNRCFGRGGEFHLLSKRPKRPYTSTVDPSSSPLPNSGPRSSFSSISMGPAPSVRSEPSPPEQKVEGHIERSFSTSLDSGCQLVCMREDSVVILDTGATANLVCSRWLSRRNSFPE